MEIALLTFYNSLKAKYQAFVISDRFALQKTSLWLCLFSVCTSFPNYDYFLHPNAIVAKNWAVLAEQSANPLTPMHYPADEHYGQLAFRILLPGIAHILHFPVGLFFAFLPVMAWLFFWGVLAILRKASIENWTALLVTLGLAATYVGKAFFMDLVGYFDAYCYVLLLAAILVPGRLLSFLAYLAAIHVDERAYLAIPLAAFVRMQHGSKPVAITIPTLLRSTWPALLAVVVGLAIRYSLHSVYGLASGAQSDNLGLVTLRGNFVTMSIGILSGLDGWLLIAAVPAWYLWNEGAKLFSLGWLIYLAVSIIALCLVLDMTRCIAYLFPAVLAGVIFLNLYERPAFVEKTVAIFCGFALLLPPLFVVGDTVVWMAPILPKIFRLLALLGFGHHI